MVGWIIFQSFVYFDGRLNCISKNCINTSDDGKICIWQTNTFRDHSVSADSVTVSLVITTMNTRRITTSMARTKPTHWTRSRMASCRSIPTTAGCSSSTPLKTAAAATATSANASMDLASKTHPWSLWYMSPLESKSDGADKTTVLWKKSPIIFKQVKTLIKLVFPLSIWQHRSKKKYLRWYGHDGGNANVKLIRSWGPNFQWQALN